jgi:hypothetical protein
LTVVGETVRPVIKPAEGASAIVPLALHGFVSVEEPATIFIVGLELGFPRGRMNPAIVKVPAAAPVVPISVDVDPVITVSISAPGYTNAGKVEEKKNAVVYVPPLVRILRIERVEDHV